MRIIIPGIFFLSFIFLVACQPTENGNAPTEKKFFDLESYFEGEMEKLVQEKAFKKTTQINGKIESHDFETLNFTNELALFVDSDINRPAWQDQYKVDSTFATNGNLSTITYQALKPDLQTQKVHIVFQQNKPEFLQIDKMMENALMNASMKLEYRAGESYRIQSNQKMSLSEERKMVVEVEW